LPGGGLTAASARHETPYGTASVSWTRRDGRLALEVVVPVGATAEVHVPGHKGAMRVEHGTHTWDVPDPCPRRPPLSPEATVRELLDHPEAWQAAAAAAVAVTGLPDDAAAAARLASFLDAPLSELPLALDPEGTFHGARELTERLEEALTPYR
jgi:alpha-L-rhamnosidase